MYNNENDYFTFLTLTLRLCYIYMYPKDEQSGSLISLKWQHIKNKFKVAAY